MPPCALKNFEIQKCHQNKSKFNGVYSRNSFPKIEVGTYVINLDKYKSKAIHQIALYLNAEKVKYFDSFGVKHILKEIRKFIRNKNITSNIYRVQAYDSIICQYFYIRFTDFMFKGKGL